MQVRRLIKKQSLALFFFTPSATCFLMSAALLGSLLAEFFLGLWWVDYAATAFILAFVAREAVEAVGRAREVRGIPSAA